MFKKVYKKPVNNSVLEIPWVPYRYNRNLDKIEEFPWNLKNEGVAEDLRINGTAIAQPLHRLFKISKKPELQMHLEEMYKRYPNISKALVNAALVLSNNNVEDAKIILELQIKLTCEHQNGDFSGDDGEALYEPLNLKVDSSLSSPEQATQVSSSKVKVKSKTLVRMLSSPESCINLSNTSYANENPLKNTSVVYALPEQKFYDMSSRDSTNEKANKKCTSSSIYFTPTNITEMEISQTDINTNISFNTTQLRNYRKENRTLLNANTDGTHTAKEHIATKRSNIVESDKQVQQNQRANKIQEEVKIQQVPTSINSYDKRAFEGVKAQNSQRESVLIRTNSGCIRNRTSPNLLRRNLIMKRKVPHTPQNSTNISKNNFVTEGETRRINEMLLEGDRNNNLNNIDVNTFNNQPKPFKHYKIQNDGTSNNTSNTNSSIIKNVFKRSHTKTLEGITKNTSLSTVENVSNTVVRIPQDFVTQDGQQQRGFISLSDMLLQSHNNSKIDPRVLNDHSVKRQTSKEENSRFKKRLVLAQPNSQLLPKILKNTSQVPVQPVNKPNGTNGLPQTADPRFNEQLIRQMHRYDNISRDMSATRDPDVSNYKHQYGGTPSSHVPPQECQNNNRCSKQRHTNIYHNPQMVASKRTNSIPSFNESFGQHTNVNLSNLSIPCDRSLTCTTYLKKPSLIYPNQPWFDPSPNHYIGGNLLNRNPNNFVNLPLLNPAYNFHPAVNQRMRAPVPSEQNVYSNYGNKSMANPVQRASNGSYNTVNQNGPTPFQNCSNQNNSTNKSVGSSQLQYRPFLEADKMIANPCVVKIPYRPPAVNYYSSPPNVYLPQGTADPPFRNNRPLLPRPLLPPNALIPSRLGNSSVKHDKMEKNRATQTKAASCDNSKKRKASDVPANNGKKTNFSAFINDKPQNYRSLLQSNNKEPNYESTDDISVNHPNASGDQKLSQSVDRVSTKTSQLTLPPDQPNVSKIHTTVSTNNNVDPKMSNELPIVLDSSNPYVISLPDDQKNVPNMHPTGFINSVGIKSNSKSHRSNPNSKNKNTALSELIRTGYQKCLHNMHPANSPHTTRTKFNNYSLDTLSSMAQNDKSLQMPPKSGPKEIYNMAQADCTNTFNSKFDSKVPNSTNQNVTPFQETVKNNQLEISNMRPDGYINTSDPKLNNSHGSVPKSNQTVTSGQNNILNIYQNDSTTASDSKIDHTSHGSIPNSMNQLVTTPLQVIVNNGATNTVGSKLNNNSLDNVPDSTHPNITFPNDAARCDQNNPPIIHTADSTNTVGLKKNNEPSNVSQENLQDESNFFRNRRRSALKFINKTPNNRFKKQGAKNQSWLKQIQVLLIELKIAFVTFLKISNLRHCSKLKQKRYLKALLKIKKAREKIQKQAKTCGIMRQNKSDIHVAISNLLEITEHMVGQNTDTLKENSGSRLLNANETQRNSLENDHDVPKNIPLSVCTFSEMDSGRATSTEKFRSSKSNKSKRSAVQSIDSSSVGNDDKPVFSKNIKMRIIKENLKYSVKLL